MYESDHQIESRSSNEFVRRLGRMRTSTWVILGYVFWVGFLLGAIIMHTIAR
jgi:hypothetical protein